MRRGRRSPACVTWFKWSFRDSISLIQVCSVFCAGSWRFHPWRASEWRMGPWGEALRHHTLDKALLVEVWNSRVRAKFGLMYIRNEHKWRICFHAQILWKSVDLCGACGIWGRCGWTERLLARFPGAGSDGWDEAPASKLMMSSHWVVTFMCVFSWIEQLEFQNFKMCIWIFCEKKSLRLFEDMWQLHNTASKMLPSEDTQTGKSASKPTGS